jgi:large subunit ribosomal protein L6
MSRIGRLPVQLPTGVKVQQADDILKVEGPKGKLQQAIPEGVTIVIEEKELRVERDSDSKHHRALHGLIRSLANNMVIGVTEGFTKSLQVVGVGYTAKKQGNKLLVQAGLANTLEFEIPKGVDVADPVTGSLPSGSRSMPMTIVTISGPDKQVVGQLAASIRASRPPEPYLGKGIRYADEEVRRKAGKRFGAGA